MQWTKKSAHLVLQMRTQVLDERLEETFRHWYPDFRTKRLKHPLFYALPISEEPHETEKIVRLARHFESKPVSSSLFHV